MTRLLILCFLLGFLFMNCARAPLSSPEGALRKAKAPPIQDDLPMGTLIQAVETEIGFLEKSTSPREFIFGKERFTQAEYIQGLRRVLELARTSPSPQQFYESLQKEFDFYEVYGQKDWAQVFITSYFEPVVAGSLKKTKKFTSPLLKMPPDLITLDLSSFDPRLPSERKFRGRVQNKSFVPYYSRAEIENQGVFAGRHLEICWVDPIDSFFLQIQGSGTVDLGNGHSLFLNYAAQNGHRYEAIGAYLKDVIPLEQMNLYTIENYLRTLPPTQMHGILNKNPSYVFFQTLDQHAITYLGVPATSGRTIATDKRYFPKGALALLSFNKPVLDPKSPSTTPIATEAVGRLVLDQDIGGAIQGGGRVDLFWGQGQESKRYAGIIKNPGTLYYLAPKRPSL